MAGKKPKINLQTIKQTQIPITLPTILFTTLVLGIFIGIGVRTVGQMIVAVALFLSIYGVIRLVELGKL